MNRNDSLKPVTRRALRFNYRSPLICTLVVESGSGSSATSLIEFTPVYRVPGTVLKACPTDDHTIVLDWVSIQNAFAYVVYRSEHEFGIYRVVASGMQETTYVDTPPEPGTYYYRVTGIEPNFGETDVSNTVNAAI